MSMHSCCDDEKESEMIRALMLCQPTVYENWKGLSQAHPTR
ncbi:hypothetical protein OKW42_007464 [Paraburkholderia sp. WC7.3d]